MFICHTCGPHILCTRPESWWSHQWSSCLSPPPGGPGLQLWRTLYFDRCDTGSGPAPERWSEVRMTKATQWQVQQFEMEKNKPFFFFYFYFWNRLFVLTMSTQACLPSIKPLGMAFGVRISYLRHRWAESNYSSSMTLSCNCIIKDDRL